MSYTRIDYSSNGNRLSTLSDLWLDNFPGPSIDPGWTQYIGTWSIDVANGLKGQSTSTVEADIARGASLTNSNGYTFQSQIMLSTCNDVGLFFDAAGSGSSMYLIRATGYIGDRDSPSDPTPKTALWKKVSGTWTKLTSGAGANMVDASGNSLIPAGGSFYTLKITVSGSTISWAYQVNGVWSNAASGAFMHELDSSGNITVTYITDRL